jgi:hypothetical protein
MSEAILVEPVDPLPSGAPAEDAWFAALFARSQRFAADGLLLLFLLIALRTVWLLWFRVLDPAVQAVRHGRIVDPIGAEAGPAKIRLGKGSRKVE